MYLIWKQLGSKVYPHFLTWKGLVCGRAHECVPHTTQAEDVQPQCTQCVSVYVYGFAHRTYSIFLNTITLSSIHQSDVHCMSIQPSQAKHGQSAFQNSASFWNIFWHNFKRAH